MTKCTAEKWQEEISKNADHHKMLNCLRITERVYKGAIEEVTINPNTRKETYFIAFPDGSYGEAQREVTHDRAFWSFTYLGEQ